MNQKTIANSVSIKGIALHSGQLAALTIHPAPPNTGIVFVVAGAKIPATIDQLKETNRGTSLNKIATVEHFLSAAFGLAIDNLLIEVESGSELPLLDGSALPFAQALRRAQIIEQPAQKRFFQLTKNIRLTDGDSSLEARPYHGFMVDFMIKFQGVGEQSFSFNADIDSYLKEIAPARTFGYLEEYEALKEKKLAAGASYENTLVLDKNGYVNEPRFANEPVRHKILDLIGDLSLLGRPLLAEIIAKKSGHRLNAELVRRIRENG